MSESLYQRLSIFCSVCRKEIDYTAQPMHPGRPVDSDTAVVEPCCIAAADRNTIDDAYQELDSAMDQIDHINDTVVMDLEADVIVDHNYNSLVRQLKELREQTQEALNSLSVIVNAG